MKRETHKHFPGPVFERGAPSTLYLVELTNGMVKVGMSTNPVIRMKNISSAAFGRFGAKVEDAVYFVAAGGHEELCIKALGEVATIVPKTREYFTGISLAKAKGIVEGVLEGLSRPMEFREHPDYFGVVVEALKLMEPREINATAVACGASFQTLKNMRDARLGPLGPSYRLVMDLYTYVTTPKETTS